jgi:hypothetical protein
MGMGQLLFSPAINGYYDAVSKNRLSVCELVTCKLQMLILANNLSCVIS